VGKDIKTQKNITQTHRVRHIKYKDRHGEMQTDAQSQRHGETDERNTQNGKV